MLLIEIHTEYKNPGKANSRVYHCATFEGSTVRRQKSSPICPLARLMIEELGIDPDEEVLIKRQDKPYPSFEPARVGYWADRDFLDSDSRGLEVRRHNRSAPTPND